MDVYSRWPLLLCLALLVGIASTPVFVLADKPPSDRPNRILALDGLRGFLALAVYFHHAIITHRYILSGVWDVPPSGFYTVLGQGGVSLFFMITGFLFWSRLVQEQGRPSWIRLFIGRVFRIAPLYLVAIFAMFLVVGVQSRFATSLSWAALMVQVLSWLSLGLFQNDLNGIDATSVLAGVTWSLRYEWIFYGSLPLAALLARRRGFQFTFTLVGLTLSVAIAKATHALPAACAALFFAGMASASAPKLSLQTPARNLLASALVTTLLIVTLTTASTAYSLRAVGCMSLAFYLVVSGCTCFGILTTRAAQRLGDVSYGTYLLQGLVLTLVVRPLATAYGAVEQPELYWAVVALGSVVLIAVAAVTHATIERPGIQAGRAVASWTVRLLHPVPIAGGSALPEVRKAT